MSKRRVLGYEIVGTVLTVSVDDEVVRRFDRSKLPQKMIANMLDLGTTTKLANCGAKKKDEPELTTEQKLARMDALWAAMLNGEWTLAGERFVWPDWLKPFRANVDAMVRLKGWDRTDTAKKLAEAGEARAKKYLTNPEVLEMVAEMAAAEGADLSEFE